jgi:hypothetical protein
VKGVAEIKIEQVAANDFRLTVDFDGQSFVCGSYLTRVAAHQAGRLMIERKEGEKQGRKRRVRKK